MVTATLALIGFFISLYLALWKIGLVGTLACEGGACEVVQLSPYANVLGIPVAFYGVGGYLALFAVSLVGLHGRWAARRTPTLWLVALSAAGMVFTAYLTYLEAAVIRAWCRWCVVSAGIITAIFATSVIGWRATTRMPAG